MKNSNYIILFVSIFFMFPAYSISQNYWTGLDGPYGGNTIEIKKHPDGSLYALRNEGLYRSTNSGDSWHGIPEGSVNSNLSMDISPTGVIYVGKSTGGIWWTGNTGQSWNFNSVRVAPHSGLWASVVITKINAPGYIFINSYSSVNGGQTFNMFSNINSVGVSNDYAFNGSNQVYSASNTGVNYSVNNGSTWININGNLPNFSGASALILDDNILIAGINGSGIFKTSNNGTDWTAINNGITDLSINKLYIDSQNNYYAGTSTGKVFKSSDGGSQWSLIFNGSSENRVNSILADGNSLYLALTSLGIVKSTDNGVTWIHKNKNLFIQGLSSMAFSDNEEIYAGSSYGFFYSSDKGSQWEKRNGSLPAGISVLYRSSNGDILAGINNNSVFRTTNNGVSWEASGTGIDPGTATIRLIKNSPDGSVFAVTNLGAFFDTAKVYRSSDNGNSWTNVSHPDFSGMTEFTIDGAGTLYFAGTNAAFESTLFKSADNGNTWAKTELTGFFRVDNLAASGNNLYLSSSDKVYLSADKGSNWNQLNSGNWNGSSINSILINSAGKIILSTSSGIFISTNNGDTWSQENSGLPQSHIINNLFFDNEEFLYGTTYYEGIYKSVRSTLTSVAGNANISPSEFILEQNYPNPFNPSTVIRYSVPSDVRGQTSDVKLIVYNNLGKKVATLVNESQPSGIYSVEFNAKDLSSGVYYYKLEAGNFRETKRMLMVK